MDLKIFWQNIEDAKELGEEENLKKRELFDGEKLYPYVLLLNEYLKVSSVFTFIVGEEFELEKYNKFRIMLSELHDAIDNLNYNQNIDIMTLQKIIVHLDLEMGIDITYYSVFLEMLENHELTEDYNELNYNDNFTFKYLTEKYGGHSKKRSR